MQTQAKVVEIGKPPPIPVRSVKTALRSTIPQPVSRFKTEVKFYLISILNVRFRPESQLRPNLKAFKSHVRVFIHTIKVIQIFFHTVFTFL